MGFKPRQPGKTYSMEATTEFLNVDLDLEGPSDLAPLIEAMGQVFVLHSSTREPFVASLEIEPGVGMDFDATMLKFVAIVEGLDSRARALWNVCTTRSFDIGLQSGLEPHRSQYHLSATLVRELASIGADIVVTVYGAQYESLA